MQQGGRVDELHDASELRVFIGGVAAHAGAQEKEQRPDAFTASTQDLGGDGIDQSDAGVEILVDPVLNPVKFLTV